MKAVSHVRLGSIDSPRQMSDTERAYWAAMVDGEGSISINAARMKGQRDQYRLAVTISNTCFEVLQALLDMVGVGTISRRVINHDKWKDGGQLFLHHENAIFCLEQIRPYLIIKGEQADIALEFIKLKRAWSRANDNWLEQLALRERMLKLNARGKASQKDYTFVKKDNVRFCEYDGCDKVHYGNGLCRQHHNWVYHSKTWNEATDRKCEFCHGDIPVAARIDAKFCSTACKMKQYRRSGCYTSEALADAPRCEVEACDRPRHADNVCRRHYMQRWHAKQKGLPPPV